MILMILAVYFCKSFRISRMLTKILFISFTIFEKRVYE